VDHGLEIGSKASGSGHFSTAVALFDSNVGVGGSEAVRQFMVAAGTRGKDGVGHFESLVSVVIGTPLDFTADIKSASESLVGVICHSCTTPMFSWHLLSRHPTRAIGHHADCGSSKLLGVNETGSAVLLQIRLSYRDR